MHKKASAQYSTAEVTRDAYHTHRSFSRGYLLFASCSRPLPNPPSTTRRAQPTRDGVPDIRYWIAKRKHRRYTTAWTSLSASARS